MAPMLAILRKELRGYFSSPIAYVFIILFTAYTAARFFWTGSQETGLNFFVKGQAALTDFFSYFPAAFMVMVPAMAMRLWPDELKSGTMEILQSLPLRSWQVVLGKYFASLLILVIALLLTVPVAMYVADIAEMGGTSLDTGAVVAGYLGALLLGAAFMAVGMFMAALAREQVTAFLLALCVCVLLTGAGDRFFLLVTPEWLIEPSRFVGFGVRFDAIERGVLDIREVVYFLSYCVFFSLFNVAVLEGRRWK